MTNVLKLPKKPKAPDPAPVAKAAAPAPVAKAPRPKPAKPRPQARPPAPKPAPPEHADDPRLSKRMSELGLCSRREADEWIENGWVKVDGEVVDTLGVRVSPNARIEID